MYTYLTQLYSQQHVYTLIQKGCWAKVNINQSLQNTHTNIRVNLGVGAMPSGGPIDEANLRGGRQVILIVCVCALCCWYIWVIYVESSCARGLSIVCSFSGAGIACIWWVFYIAWDMLLCVARYMANAHPLELLARAEGDRYPQVCIYIYKYIVLFVWRRDSIACIVYLMCDLVKWSIFYVSAMGLDDPTGRCLTGWCYFWW